MGPLPIVTSAGAGWPNLSARQMNGSLRFEAFRGRRSRVVVRSRRQCLGLGSNKRALTSAELRRPIRRLNTVGAQKQRRCPHIFLALFIEDRTFTERLSGPPGASAMTDIWQHLIHAARLSVSRLIIVPEMVDRLNDRHPNRSHPWVRRGRARTETNNEAVESAYQNHSRHYETTPFRQAGCEAIGLNVTALWHELRRFSDRYKEFGAWLIA